MSRQRGLGVVILALASGAVIASLGFTALQILPKPLAFQTFQNALILGGGLLITGLFAIKNRWHGIIGSGVMALLGTAAGVLNVEGVASWMLGDPHSHPSAPIEMGATLICLLLLIRVIATLRRERTRKLLADQAGQD